MTDPISDDPAPAESESGDTLLSGDSAHEYDHPHEIDHTGEYHDDCYDEYPRPPSFWRRLWNRRRWFYLAAVLFVLWVSYLLFDNNISLTGTTRAEFVAQLDRSNVLATEWMLERKYEFYEGTANPALVYMIRDMAGMTPDSSLTQIPEAFIRRRQNSGSIWVRMIDPSVEVRKVTLHELEAMADYQAWIAYGMAPDKVLLEEQEIASMLSPSAHARGSRTHQVLALLIAREHGRAPEVLSPNAESIDELIDTLCEGIASEAVWDVRVTDHYLQRVALLLSAGRPDLVKRRWVERILAHQKAEGGYPESWYGWGPGFLQFSFNPSPPSAHASVQGFWITYMLKHRYGEWIDQNFEE